MSTKATDQLKKKYFEYFDTLRSQHKYTGGTDIGLWIAAETIVKEIINSEKPKKIGAFVVKDNAPESLFLNDIDHICYFKKGDIDPYTLEIPEASMNDLIFSMFPTVIRYPSSKDNVSNRYKFYNSSSGESIRTSFEIIRTLDTLKTLSNEGTGVCFLGSYYLSFDVYELRTVLEDNGFYIKGTFRLPASPMTRLRTIGIVVTRNKADAEFFVDFETLEAIPKFFQTLKSNTTSNNLREGIWLDSQKVREFEDFDKWYLKDELDQIGGDFTKFDTYKIDNLCEIKTSKTRKIKGKIKHYFDEEVDAIYLPRTGTGNAILEIEYLRSPGFYFQLVVETNKVIPTYLASFLNSTFGKKLRQAHMKGDVIKNLTKSSIQNMMIGLPPLNQQIEIVSNIQKVNILQDKISNYVNNLSINPISDKQSLSKVDSLVEIVSGLTDPDRVKAIIRRGEDKITEFKQTLSLDVAKKTKEKYITDSALKTICAFLNSDGGDLVIGVDDEKNITGVSHEIKKFHKGDSDKFLNNFKDLFKKHIGPEFYPYVDQKIIEVGADKVFLVSCKPSDQVVFLDGTSFYVRTTPATDKLEGRAQVDYIRTRFGN